MKKVLFLSHIPPFPVVGGDRLRIWQSLSLLCENYDVDIAFISHNKSELSVIRDLPPSAAEKCFYVPLTRRYMQAAHTLYNNLPLAVNHFHHAPLQKWIDDNIGKYDTVFCASPVMAFYLRGHNRMYKLLDMTDSLSMNYRNAANHARGLRKLLYHADAARMENYERQCLNEFDAVAYISPVDRDYLSGGKKYIVGNAIKDVPEQQRCLYNPESRDIVFVGKMDYEPNVLAVDFFAREILPQLNSGLENPYRFIIVGASPSRLVLSLAKLPNVQVTGFVDSVTPYYRNAAIVVAPMLTGSGVQNKILQALAHGCHVATTPTGFEGIERLGDVVTVIPPQADIWAETLRALLDKRNTLAVKGKLAPQRVSEEFGIGSVRAQFRNFVNSY